MLRSRTLSLLLLLPTAGLCAADLPSNALTPRPLAVTPAGVADFAMTLDRSGLSWSTQGVQAAAGLPEVVLVGADPKGPANVLACPADAQLDAPVARETALGAATAQTLRWSVPGQADVSWTVSRLTGRSGLTLQMSFTNRAATAVNLRELAVFKAKAQSVAVSGNPAGWWLTCADSHEFMGHDYPISRSSQA